jgi:hypothetical protein
LAVATATHAIHLGAATVCGAITSAGEDHYYSGNAVRMPVVAGIIGILMGMVGIGLLWRIGLARFVFLVAAPWGSIAFAGVFSDRLWQKDVPSTLFLILVYVPLAFIKDTQPAKAILLDFAGRY